MALPLSKVFGGVDFQYDESTGVLTAGNAADSSGIKIVPCLKYVALLSQSGTNAPSATEFENTLGTVTWARTTTGTYTATVSGKTLTDGYTVCFTTMKALSSGTEFQSECVRTADTTFVIKVRDFGGTLVDAFNPLFLEVRVYPS